MKDTSTVLVRRSILTLRDVAYLSPSTVYRILKVEDLENFLDAVKVFDKIIRWYNEKRLHSALGFLRPVDYYRGDPEEMYAIRRHKLAQARHRQNLQLPQPTLPFTSEETVA